MRSRSLLFAACLIMPLYGAAHADGFRNITLPSFGDIEPRMVYGQAVYDVGFAGDGPKTKGESARKFLERIIKSKFSNSSGNYIVTLDVAIDGRTVVTEPIISANWDKKKFLFVTTSSTESLVVNKAGVLLDGIVIDNAVNKVDLSMKVLFSKTSSVDLSLFKTVSELSKSATVSAFAPGVPAVMTAVQPFADVLQKLLSNYKSETIVENTVGAFTLLDDGFANQLRFRDNNLIVNIFLRTENSQLPRNFDAATGKFKDTSADSALANVESGIGPARATVFDIIQQDNDPNNDALKTFVGAILKAAPMAGGTATPVRPQCAALKARLNRMVTTRDTSLVYWAFLRTYGSEIRKYGDGKACGDTALADSLGRLGLDLGPEWVQ